MAAFNLTAELNLRGPSNLNQVVGNIRRQLSTLTLDLNINPATSRGIQAVTADVRTLSTALRDAQTNAVALGAALRGLGASVSNLAASTGNLNTNLTSISRNASSTGTAIRAASSEMSEFGRQSALAIRRFAAFSVATGAVYALSRAVTSAYGEFLSFNKEFVRLQQVTDSTSSGLKSLSNEITRLATSLGVGSQELVQVSVTLAQAGLSAGETKTALEALAKSALAPSFDDLNSTVEGSIALMRQFGISAADLESSLGSVNAVAAKFAVEASDIITAIQRTGGVFANASKGVSEGKDALNEFLAVFTSVRATTRESAETIATGLRTIFTRIQRGGTIDALKEYGIQLTDLEGKFVGPYEAVRRLSEGLKSLDPRDLRFSQIVEELGGFRQIGKVIPLIQQFETAQKALGVAQRGSGSLAADAATAQEALSIKISKVREQFIGLIRDIGQSQGFQTFVDISLKLASALISVADAAKDVLPAIAAITAIRGVGALGQFFSGFSGGIGRRPRGFARGGRVPGSGSGDTVPAMLTPGEFVIRKKAVDAIGVSNLHSMNKYARGGRVKKFRRGGIADAPMVDDILQTSGAVLPKPSAVEALIRAGGGAVDIDRTLKRTIGDKAYSKAQSAGAQKSVLDKYFVDDMARLQDIKSSPLTAFGKSLQDAIRSGQLKGNRVSIISKSRRTKGVPEYLSQLFGIPVQNMIFTQGGDKQPAMDAIRSKGPRIERVGKFKTGGFIQKFAGGGFIEYLKGGNNDVGAAILEQGGLKPQPFTISEKELETAVGSKLDTTKLPSLKIDGKLEGLNSKSSGVFDEALEKGIVQGVNIAARSVAKGLGFSDSFQKIPMSSAQSFISGINVAAKGNLFEDVLFALKESPGPFTERKAGQPFDFPTGLPSVLKDDYKNLPSAWVDAKASFGTAERSGRGLPDKALKQLRNEIKGNLDFYKTAEEEKQQKTTQAVLSKFTPGKTYSLQELGMTSTEAKSAGFVSPYRGKWQIPVRQASGGSISGEDTVPALLTPGEFVINKKAAKRIGASRLNQLNKADKIQGFNSGGFVQHFATGGPAARPTNPSGFSVVVPNATIAALRDMGDALEALGVSASASARLVERGGAINIRESERAYQADIARMRMAGASAIDLYNAEQNLARVRRENALKIDTAREMGGFGGARLQDIQTRAEAEQQRIIAAQRARGATDEQLAANMQRIRGRAFENVTAAEMGTSRRGLAARGMTGGTIEQYISQSMMDTRTLRQMNNQLRQTREEELRNSTAFTSASNAEQRRMLRELRSRTNEEIAERRNIAQQLRSERGLGGGTFGRIGRTLGTAGALVGMGEMREDAFGTGRRGTGFARGWNRLSQGTQQMGFGLTFAGGLLGDLAGKARGGKEGEALSAGISAFVGSAGIGMMFGPIGALTGMIVGATAALKAYTQSLIDSTIAEETQKVEGATLRVQKAFERLDKSTKRTDIQSNLKGTAQELGQIATVESRKQNAITDKALSEKGMFDLGPNMARIEKELVASARQTNVLQSLPQIFEQGMAKGLTVQQIQASFPPGELDKLKEVFATASGDSVIAGLVAKREEMQTRGADTSTIDAAIQRMSAALFNKDILKPLMDRKAAEDAMATAAAAATVKVNLLAEVLKGISAAASKAGASFEEAQRQIAITAGSAFGETFKVQGPSRQQENILDNIQAYSTNEIRNVIGQIGQQFQFNPAVTREAQGAAVNQRILGEELPKILAEVAAKEGQGFDPEGAPANVIRKKLDEVFKTAIPDAGTRGETVQRLVDKIGERLRSRQGITVEELAGDERALSEIMKSDADAIKVFNDLLKQSNGIIAELNNSMNNWATQMSQAIQGRIEAQNIGIDANNQLAKTLGQELSLGDMNAVFENTIQGLTQRIGAGGVPIAGTGTMDPGTIMQRMLDKEQEARDIQKQLETEKPPIDSARYKSLNEALRRSTLEARNLATAHQKLQSDSSRAANALTKIGELRQLQESRQGTFLDVLKNVNNPEAMMQFTNEVQSFMAQMAGQGTMQNLPQAIAGLERQMQVLKPEDAARVRSDFIQSVGDMLKAQGTDPALVDSILERIGAGPQLPPEMQALIAEFNSYTVVQQNAVEQAAQRTIDAANIAHDQLVLGATQARDIISGAGQQNPVNVVPAQARSNGGPIYASNGQFVNFQPKGTDTVPAMLTPGEFVVNARATKKNRALLHAINGGKVGGYSSGGLVYLADGGYVPVDKTIEDDRKALEELIRQFRQETSLLTEPLEQKRTDLDNAVSRLTMGFEGLADNDPQREAIASQVAQINSERDTVQKQITDILNNRLATENAEFGPKRAAIQAREENERMRRVAFEGKLNDTDKLTLAVRDSSGDISEERKAKREADYLKKSQDFAAAEQAQKKAQEENNQRGMAAWQVANDIMMQDPAYRRQQKVDARKKAFADEKQRRREAFLANNPAYRKRAEDKMNQEQQKLEEAKQWYLRANTTPDGKWAGKTDPNTGSRTVPKDVLAQYNKNKAQERSQANRERLLFGSPVNPLDPKAKEKKEQAKALTKEQMAEQAKMRRGEELARKFGWSLPDTSVNSGVIGSYKDLDPGDEPYELRTLSAEDRKALDDYQMQKFTAKENEERNKRMAEMKAQRDAAEAARDAEIRAQVKKEREARDAEAQKVAERRKKASDEYDARLASEKTAAEKQRADAASKAKAEEERKAVAKADQKKRERLEQAITLASEDPRSIDTARLSPDEQEEAKKAGVSEQEYAFNQSVDKFNAQLNDPSLISAETESVAAKLRDIISSNRYTADQTEKEKTQQGWFSKLKENLTFSDPYTPIITDARNKAAAAERLLSELQNQSTLSRADRIALNNRIANASMSLIRSAPGERQMFEERMALENNAIDLTRDAVIDVGTSFIPAGGALKAGRATTKAASVAYKAGKSAAVGAKAGAVSGGIKGAVVGAEEGSITKAVEETAKGAAIGAAVSAAVPIAGAAAKGVANVTGKVAAAALPKSVSGAAQNVTSRLGKASNFDVTGYIRKKLAEDDARVKAQFEAWQKAEAARQKLAAAQKTRPAPSAGSKAQADWIKKNAPLQEKSAQELSDAVTRGQEMNARFQEMGLEAPNFGTTTSATTGKAVGATKPSTTGGTRMSSQTKSLMEKSGLTEEAAVAYETKALQQQAAQKAAQEAKDAATRAKVDGGKATGSKRYDITEDMGRITEADRKGAVKAMEQAQKASDKAARKTSGKTTSTLPNKPLGEMTFEEFQALSASMNRPTLLSRAAGSAKRVGGATAGTLGVGGVGAGMYMGPLNPYSDRFIGYDAQTQKILREQEEERERIISNRQSTYRANGGLIYANKGTLVPYQPRGTDTVPAMLTPGEFVINRKAAKQNMGLLKAINNGRNVQPQLFNKGGVVPTQYYADGVAGVSGSSSSGGGVSSISIDTSSLDAAFSNFNSYVSSLSSVIDGFTQGTTELAGLSQAISSLGNLGLREGSALMANAGTSVKEATSAFSAAMAAFNSSSETLAAAIGAIPSTISLTVSGSIPVTVTVQIEGGTGGNTDTTTIEQSIMDKVGLAINAATQGGINIDTSIA